MSLRTLPLPDFRCRCGFGHAVVSVAVFQHHHEWLFVGQLGPHQLFIVQEAHQELVHCVFPTAHERAVRLAVAFRDYVRKAAGLVDLCFDCCLTFFHTAVDLL